MLYENTLFFIIKNIKQKQFCYGEHKTILKHSSQGALTSNQISIFLSLKCSRSKHGLKKLL